MLRTSLSLFMTVYTDIDDEGFPLRLNRVDLCYNENCTYETTPDISEPVTTIGIRTFTPGLDGFKLFMQSSAVRVLTTDCFVSDYCRGDPLYRNGDWPRG